MTQDQKISTQTEVKKVNASSIKRNIKTNCKTSAYSFDYLESNSPITDARVPEFDFYSNPINSQSWTYNFKRSTFIYQVIRHKVFYLKEGKSLGITSEEIFERYTQLIYSLQEIEKFEHIEEFNKYLYTCLLKVFEEEECEKNALNNDSLLEQLMLHNSTPLLILKSINETEKSIKVVDLSIRSIFDDLRFKRINTSDFDNMREQLDKRMVKLRIHQECLATSYKRIIETTKYRRRKYLKLYFSDVKAVLNLDSELLPNIDCKTVSVCTFIIEEYCRWYNRTFSNQILETRKQDDKLKRQMKRKACLKPDVRLEKLMPYVNSKLSKRQIASITGIPKSTVIRLMKNLS